VGLSEIVSSHPSIHPVTPSILLSAALAGATYTLIPGPAFLALLGIGASRGRRAGAGFLAGHFAGDILWASLALIAIIGAHAISRTFFDTLGIVCGCYLCWLGFGALRARRDATGRLTAEPRRPLVRGLTFGLTNPKGYPVAIAMFTALLSGVADRLEWAALPALLAAACAGFILADIALVLLVGTGWVRRFYARHDIGIARASGLIFIGFGIHAITEALPGWFGRRA
jgi:threonine/homoserine/homoserine lactone efflux protein